MVSENDGKIIICSILRLTTFETKARNIIRHKPQIVSVSILRSLWFMWRSLPVITLTNLFSFFTERGFRILWKSDYKLLEKILKIIRV